MTTLQQKLLKALDLTLDDLSEERLIDVLLDNYKFKAEQVETLANENLHEREQIQGERDAMRKEHHDMRCNPLYGPTGEYFFACEGHRYRLIVEGGRRLQLFKKQPGAEYVARSISREEFLK